MGVQATAVPFIEVDENGNETPQTPDPATLVVSELDAGYVGDNDWEVCTF